MQGRAFERIPLHIKVQFSCFGIDYKGTVTNISENSMFIRTYEMSFPFESQFDVFIPLKDGDMLSVSVTVKRLSISNGNYDGIGTELLNPPQEFLDLVRNLKSA
jgi:hypothetical protein